MFQDSLKIQIQGQMLYHWNNMLKAISGQMLILSQDYKSEAGIH